MIRKNKFRGLRLDGKGWVYGGITSLSHTPDGKTYIVSNEGFENDEENEKLVFIEVIPETVGQFTGLLDKNGKEIYEGDLITCLNSKAPDGVIVWCTSEQMFKIKWISKTYVQVRGQSKYYTDNGEKLFANANLVWTVAGSIHEGKETKS